MVASDYANAVAWNTRDCAWSTFCKLNETTVGSWELVGSVRAHPASCAVTSSPSLMNSFRQMWAMIPAARASPRTLIIVLNLSLTNDMVMVSWVHAYTFSTAVIKADCQLGCFYELTSLKFSYVAWLGVPVVSELSALCCHTLICSWGNRAAVAFRCVHTDSALERFNTADTDCICVCIFMLSSSVMASFGGLCPDSINIKGSQYNQYLLVGIRGSVLQSQEIFSARRLVYW